MCAYKYWLLFIILKQQLLINLGPITVMPRKIGFTVVSSSSHEDNCGASELMVHAPTVNGWRSGRYVRVDANSCCHSVFRSNLRSTKSCCEWYIPQALFVPAAHHPTAGGKVPGEEAAAAGPPVPDFVQGGVPYWRLASWKQPSRVPRAAAETWVRVRQCLNGGIKVNILWICRSQYLYLLA